MLTLPSFKLPLSPSIEVKAMLGFVLLVTFWGNCRSAEVVPDWVLSPPAEYDMAAGDCVTYSGDIGIDRQQLAASARLALAQQMNVQIQGMDELYSKRVADGKEVKISKTFESTSKQTVDAALKGSKLVRVEIIKGQNGKMVCGLVAMPQAESASFGHNVIASAGVVLSKDTEEMLLAQFKSRAVAKH